MEDRTIHPSMKTVWLTYVLALLVVAVGIWAYNAYAQDQPAWLMAIPLLVFAIPLKMHFSRRLITLRLQDHHLTLETGMFSRTRRTVDMAKIQDVTVNQTMGQRLFGVGDLVLEDAGQRGGMAIRNVDNPRQIADAIIASSKQSPIAITQVDPKPSS
jgi:uncharacterized membrane protein YdbT with pleckstrin-like domain